MYQVNDKVVHGTHGVCEIVEIGRLAMSVADKKRQYYTLYPVYQRESAIYVPVDSDKVKIRPIITKEEIQTLLEEIPELETIWVANEREREVLYKEALLSCDCRELVRIIKTIYFRKKSRVKDGKKVAAVDERYFHMAEEQLYGELAYVLGMEKENMAAYITEHMAEKGYAKAE